MPTATPHRSVQDWQKPARKVVAKGNCSFDVRHTMTFTERSYRDAFGHIVIHSRLGPPTGRQGFEKQFFPSVEVGLPGWQRAHSQGQGTGFESPNAIRYAPAEVNQEFQRLGIERHLRELFQMKAADTELWLTTVTATHKNSLRLKEIQYRIDAVRSGASRRLFEASIEIADQKINPRVVATATPFASL
jgi:putative RNase toxin 4 of polymorphic toxin system